MRAPIKLPYIGNETDPDERDYEEAEDAYDQAQEDKFEQERDEQTHREIVEEAAAA